MSHLTPSSEIALNGTGNLPVLPRNPVRAEFCHARLLIAGMIGILFAFSTRAEERLWPSTPPAGCPFPQSAEITGLAFTGEYTNYASADTWFFSWGSDDRLYSPFADGEAGGKQARCWLPEADAGSAVMTGDDPLALRFSVSGNLRLAAKPYGGRYPCASLVHNGVWYYGSYCLMNENGSIQSDLQHPELGRINWGVMGPFCGFHVCTNLSGPWGGNSWMTTPFSGEKPMFPEPPRQGKAVKIGAPHFVDFGRNLEHSPDGKAYLVAHGATDDDPKPRVANLSWITGDQIYLIRVTPTVANINDPSSYEFFGGHDAGGKPVWTRSFAAMKPLLEWNNHCGCVTVTYLAPLKKYLLCITDGWPTAKTMDTYLLESDQLTGPWKLVTYLAKFGEQGFFANVPSRFVGPDGRTAWLCYSANFAGGKSEPVGSKPGLSLQRIRLLGPNPRRPN